MKFVDMVKQYEILKIKEKELKDALKEPVSNIILQSLDISLKELEATIKNYEETDYISLQECNSRIRNAESWAKG